MLSLFTFYFRKISGWRFAFLTGICFILIGTSNAYLSKYKFDKAPVSEHKISVVEGTIITTLKASPFYHRYLLETKSIQNKNTKSKILVYIKKNVLSKEPQTGDTFLAQTYLLPLPRTKNPFEFDYGKYLSNRGISSQIFITTDTPTKIIPTEKASFNSEKIRNYIKRRLKLSEIDSSQTGIVEALFLGDKSNLSKEVYENFKRASIVHILAVSGLHIGILFFLLNFLLSPLKRFTYGKTIASLLILVLLWLYALLVGFSPAVVRAVMMFSLYAIARNLQRPISSVKILFSALFLNLIFEPFAIFEVGFQLSYLGVLSILLFKPLLDRLYLPKSRILKLFWDIVSVSFVVQVGLLPISLFYFHQFGVLFILSNLVILLFMEVFMLIGVVTIIASLVMMLPHFWVSGVNFLVNTLSSFASWTASFESFVFENIYFNIYYLLLSYLIAYCLYKLLKERNFLWTSLLLFGVLSFQILYIFESINRKDINRLIVFSNLKTIIGFHRSNILDVCSHDDSYPSHTINNYKTGESIQRTRFLKIKNSLKYKNIEILCIDSFGVYPKIKNYQPKIVVLENAPKINLERLIENLNPKLIISQKSNYSSMVSIWRTTCEKLRTDFYDIRQRGAFIKNFN